MAAIAASSACGRGSNTETVESPSPIDFRNRPPCASTCSAISSSWRTSASAIAAGSLSHSAVEPSMSDRQNVITPVGSAAPQPLRSRSTSSPGVAGRRVGIGRQADADRGLELLGLRGVDAVPRRQHARRRRRRSAARTRWRRASRRRWRATARRRRRARARGSPACPLRRRGASGAEDMPKSTSFTRPPLVRIRFAGLTSPWMTGGSCECRCVSASAAWAR